MPPIRPEQFNRRAFLFMAAASSTMAMAQGIASRGVKPQPRGKPSGIPFLARFSDVAAQAGLTAPVIYGGVDRKQFIFETVGCGVAFFDYDNDGWLDIFLLGGTRIDPTPGSTNRLYKNNRDGTFTDVTDRAGLHRTGWASAVTIADYNNDGFEDIFITYYGQNVLYKNNGDGTFNDVTAEAGLSYIGPPRWGSGCTFLDYDRDGHLDLFVANYAKIDLDKIPKPGDNPMCNFKGIPVNCGPNGLPFARNYLYKNQGDGTFRDVTIASGIAAAPSSYGMTAIAADFTGDGWTDLYLASDSTPSLLFINQRNGTFREEGTERGVAFSDDGKEQAGMGVAIGDYRLNGHLDIFKTHFSDDTDVLYRNDGSGMFTDVTLEARLGVETRFIQWGTGFADFDNDGWPDIFVATGSVYPEVEARLPEYPLKTPRLIFRNLGNGKFEELIEEAGPGIGADHCSRGCALGDFDNDGDVDIVVVNLNESPSLLRNDLKGDRNWVKVRLVGTKTNRSAIGSKVLARYGGKVQAQSVTAQSSFYSVNDRRLHFGLGDAKTTDLEIHWTNGDVERLSQVKSHQLIVVQEGRGIVHAESWPTRTKT
jgi:enediyne biosynthesis protein E4